MNDLHEAEGEDPEIGLDESDEEEDKYEGLDEGVWIESSTVRMS